MTRLWDGVTYWLRWLPLRWLSRLEDARLWIWDVPCWQPPGYTRLIRYRSRVPVIPTDVQP